MEQVNKCATPTTKTSEKYEPSRRETSLHKQYTDTVVMKTKCRIEVDVEMGRSKTFQLRCLNKQYWKSSYDSFTILPKKRIQDPPSWTVGKGVASAAKVSWFWPHHHRGQGLGKLLLAQKNFIECSLFNYILRQGWLSSTNPVFGGACWCEAGGQCHNLHPAQHHLYSRKYR